MTTATGEFAIDFKTEADTEDYTNPNLTFVGDKAQIDSGLLTSLGDISNRIAFYDSVHLYEDAKASRIEKNSPSDGGGECGPGLYSPSGNGYELKIVWNELRIFKVTAWARDGALGNQVNMEYPAGSVFELAISQFNELTAKCNGTPIEFEEIIDGTYYPFDLVAGSFSDRDGGGGGYQSGIYSFAADGLSTNATIDYLPVSVHVGDTFEINTTNLATLTTETTVGGKAVIAADAPDGDGTLTIADFVDGEYYPYLGGMDVIARDVNGKTAEGFTGVYIYDGWQTVTVVNINTGPWSLAKAISGDTVVNQVSVIDDGVGILNSDLTLTNWALGEYVAWMREEDGTMRKVNFTVTQSGVNGSAGFVEPVEFVGFIQ